MEYTLQEQLQEFLHEDGELLLTEDQLDTFCLSTEEV